ncbi:MAG: MBL fold metallo-hydrolase [Proteobacteria bacterium]|nr:MBL fold metallo-hydrolase [Pseudomonadota bacterium]
MLANKSKILLMLVTFFNLAACASARDTGRFGNYEVLTLRHSYANSHIIKLLNGNYFMFDAGGYEDAAKLESEIIGAGIDPKKILAIFVSHAHWDHAAGAKYFQDKHKTRVILGEGDKLLLSQGKSDALCPTNFFAKLRLKSDQEHSFKPPAGDLTVVNATALSHFIEGTEGVVVPVPSHTEGSLAVVIGKIAFVGDLFRGTILGSGAALHFYICDVEKNRETIRSFLKNEAAQVEFFFPGHFGPVLTRKDVVSFFFGNEQL